MVTVWQPEKKEGKGEGVGEAVCAGTRHALQRHCFSGPCPPTRLHHLLAGPFGNEIMIESSLISFTKALTCMNISYSNHNILIFCDVLFVRKPPQKVYP